MSVAKWRNGNRLTRNILEYSPDDCSCRRRAQGHQVAPAKPPDDFVKRSKQSPHSPLNEPRSRATVGLSAGRSRTHWGKPLRKETFMRFLPSDGATSEEDLGRLEVWSVARGRAGSAPTSRTCIFRRSTVVKWVSPTISSRPMGSTTRSHGVACHVTVPRRAASRAARPFRGGCGTFHCLPPDRPDRFQGPPPKVVRRAEDMFRQRRSLFSRR